MAENYKSGIKVERDVPIDLLYGPYKSIDDANSKVTPYLRSVSNITGLKVGRTVAIDNGTIRQEYWWDNGITDTDLVVKSGGGTSFDPTIDTIGIMSPLNAPVVSNMTVNEAFNATQGQVNNLTSLSFINALIFG